MMASTIYILYLIGRYISSSVTWFSVFTKLGVRIRRTKELL